MNAPEKLKEQSIAIMVGEAQVSVPAEAAVLAYLERMLDESRSLTVDVQRFDVRMPPATPAIGSEYEGGIYAGLTVHQEQPMHLVLLPGEASDLNWEQAKEWAKPSGGELPSRMDQLVLFKNLKSEFKDAWYWSGEQHAGERGYAWIQDFSNGGQLWGPQGNDFRARAVRRVSIR